MLAIQPSAVCGNDRGKFKARIAEMPGHEISFWNTKGHGRRAQNISTRGHGQRLATATCAIKASPPACKGGCRCLLAVVLLDYLNRRAHIAGNLEHRTFTA
jgi:hypothetical protein